MLRSVIAIGSAPSTRMATSDGLVWQSHMPEGVPHLIGPMTLALLGLLIAAGLLLAFWKSPPHHLLSYLATAHSSPQARGLCFPIYVANGIGHRALLYLRALGCHEAELVADEPWHRGQRLTLPVPSLPGYSRFWRQPWAAADVPAHVVQCRQLPGGGYAILVRFKPLPPIAGSVLHQYISSLARRGL